MSRQLCALVLVLAVAACTAELQGDNFLRRASRSVLAQEPQVNVWVYFTDKPETAASRSVDLHELTHQRRRRALGTTEVVREHDLDVSQTYIDAVLAVHPSMKLRHVLRWSNAITISMPTNTPELAAEAEAALAAIAALPFVRADEMDSVARYHQPAPQVDEVETPGETERVAVRAVRDAESLLATSAAGTPFVFDYGKSGTAIRLIRADELHRRGLSGRGVRIMVVDSGFFYSHETFAQTKIVKQWDFIQNDNDTRSGAGDAEGQQNHGTAVLSTVGGLTNGTLVGVAFGAEFLLAKTEDTSDEYRAEEDRFIAAMEWGEKNGAAIVSASLGYKQWYSNGDLDGVKSALSRAVTMAASLGQLMVVAQGNSGNKGIGSPADSSLVLAVGAVNGGGNVAAFSARGPTADGRIKPDVSALGVKAWVASPRMGAYSDIAGTSFATPSVAGVAALILEAHPDWTAMMVRDALILTASQTQNPDNLMGWGIVDAVAATDYSPLRSCNGAGPQFSCLNGGTCDVSGNWCFCSATPSLTAPTRFYGRDCAYTK